MSIIIRLQNLPLSAKSGDIRHFFGGLRIPNGGVHIVGGSKGDAFIAFTTDEDARLAMRKDGGKILDSRVKLYLSSRVEMQQEIGRITDEEDDTIANARQQRLPLGMQVSIGGDPDYSRSYRTNSPSRRARSPYARGSRSPRRRSSRSPRRRSRSPRKRSRSPMMSSKSRRSRSPMMSTKSRRSRSPMMSSGSRRSRSPIKRTFMTSTGQRSTVSPHRSGADSSVYRHETDMVPQRDGKLVDVEMLFGVSKGSSNWNYQDFPRREDNTLLEQKIAEALNASLSSIGKMYNKPSVNETLTNMQGERIDEPVGNLHGGRFVESGLNIQGGRDPGMNIHRGRIGDHSMNIQGGRIGVPGMNIQEERFGDQGMNIQGGRIGDPRMNMQGGRIGDPGMNIQGERIGDPGMNIQGGRIGDPGMNMQGGRIGDPGMNIQCGRIDDSGMNIHGGRIGDLGMNIQGGRIDDPRMNMQGGGIGDPGINMQGGRIGDPGINIHGGRIGEPGMNVQEGRIGDPGMNIRGGRIGDLGINMQPVRREEQFSTLNPNAMPFQPKYNSLGLREMPVQENNRLVLPNMHSSSNMTVLTTFNPSVQPLQYPPPMSMPPRVNLPPTIHISTMPPPLPMPPPMSLAAMPPDNMKPSTQINPNTPLKGYFLTLSGLDPLWNVNDVQSMLKGIFVPSKNVKWELDDMWVKTGKAFVKFYNKDDFMQLVSFPTYTYNGKIITVNECPDFIFCKYFLPEVPSEGSLNSPSGEFYHKITGLPYEANYDNVLNFFDGLEVIDLYIIFSKNSEGFRIQGKATGIAFIAFGNSNDCSKAMLRNGRCFGNSKRFVQIASSNKRCMLEAKQKNLDLLSQSTTFVCSYNTPKDGGSFQKHLPCIFLTELPQNISKIKIIAFFKKFKLELGNIHLIDKEVSKGRAFVELKSYQDLNRALSCNGKKLNNQTVFVRQISYEEMMKCLEPQQRNNFENVPQTPLHSHPNSSTEMFKNQSDPGKHSAIEENFRPSEFNSGRNVIQVFEYGNQSRKPIPIPTATSNHSLGIKKPLKPCLKNTKSSNREDLSTWPPSDLHIEEARKQQESSFNIVSQKSNQSTPSGGLKKVESSRNEVQKPKETLHIGESKKPESSVAGSDKTNSSKVLSKDDVKDPKQSDHSRELSQAEIENEAMKMEMEEESRIPVKFEVKIKPAISKNVKVEDAFDNADTKKKLSKLSPERKPVVSAKLSAVAEKDKSDKNDEGKSINKKLEAVKTGDDKNVKPKNTDNDKSFKTKSTDGDKNVKPKNTDNDKSFKTKSTDDDKNVKNKNTNDINVKTKGTDGKNGKTKDTNDKIKKAEADKNPKTKISDGGKNVKDHESASKPKTKSPEKKSEKAKSIEVRSSNRSEKDRRYSKNFRSRNPSPDRSSSSRRYNEDRRRSPEKSNARRRPISRSPVPRSPPRHSNYSSENLYNYSSATVPAVVQLCNVDPLIGSAELLRFFYEFDIDADTIIRRLNDQGESTGDVRVTFRSHRDAEIAVRSYNGRLLSGLPISMFHVD